MRIIKPGVKPADKIGTGTCYTCKCEIEVTRGECQHHVAYDQRDTDSYSYTCPTCNGNIIINHWRDPTSLEISVKRIG